MTKFIWNGAAYLFELDEASTTKTVFTQEPGGHGGLTSQYRFNRAIWKPSYYHQDALGGTMQLTDDSEEITDTYLYDAWGNTLDRTGTTETPFQWIGAWGYYKDGATGLYYVRRRSYQPTTGRWTSSDPLLFVDGPNLYVAYFVPSSIDLTGTGPTLYPKGPYNPDNSRDFGSAIEPFTPPQNTRGLISAAGASAAGAVVIDGPLPVGDLVALGILVIAIPLCLSRICAPCPPGPGVEFRVDWVPPSKPHFPCPGSHTHIYWYEVNQMPYPDCACFYNKREYVKCQ